MLSLYSHRLICLYAQKAENIRIDSSDLEPSKEDIRIAKRLVEAGRLFGIKVLDHIIICWDKYKSMADEGIL